MSRKSDDEAGPADGRMGGGARTPRRLACQRCGGAFDCTLDGTCWCAGSAYPRLALPDAAEEDCLCPACLRAMATQHSG